MDVNIGVVANLFVEKYFLNPNRLRWLNSESGQKCLNKKLYGTRSRKSKLFNSWAVNIIGYIVKNIEISSWNISFDII